MLRSTLELKNVMGLARSDPFSGFQDQERPADQWVDKGAGADKGAGVVFEGGRTSCQAPKPGIFTRSNGERFLTLTPPLPTCPSDGFPPEPALRGRTGSLLCV